ncbi:MAG: hypothetical protein AB1757_09750 [Acidobacteriota bacterium]
MNRKIMYATLLLVLTAAIALGSLHKTEVKANSEVTAAAPAPVFGACDFSYVKNVKVRDLGRSDFEVTWEFASPETCLQPQAFVVEVRAKRNVGGNLLGKEIINVGGGVRRAIAKFRSLAGFDKVEATVTATISLKPFGQAFVNL